MFYFDPMYFVFALPALLLALYAQLRVSSAYGKYSKVTNSRGLSGLDAARWLLGAGGLSHVNVEGTPGRLSDHYDPRSKTLRLSKEVANTPSVASLGIVAHEIGHALQDKTGYAPMRMRSGLVPVVNLGSYLGYILFFIGLLINLAGLVWLGIIFFSGSVVFAFITLPVERDASSRALQLLTSGGLVDSQDIEGTRAVLSAAALTYLAAIAQALSNLLYFIFLALGMRRRD
jgi:Zn-dependent membrane protease YugP